MDRIQFAKSLASGGIASIISLVDGNGCVDLLTKGSKIRHQTDAFIVCFWGKVCGAAPCRGAMTFCSISSAIVFFDFGSWCFGTRLAVVTHIGMVSVCREIDIGEHLIGSGLRSSLNVLSNMRSSLVFRDVSWFGCFTVRTAFGKSVGMT